LLGSKFDPFLCQNVNISPISGEFVINSGQTTFDSGTALGQSLTQRCCHFPVSNIIGIIPADQLV